MNELGPRIPVRFRGDDKMYLKKARDMFVPFRVGDGDTAIFVAIELED